MSSSSESSMNCTGSDSEEGSATRAHDATAYSTGATKSTRQASVIHRLRLGRDHTALDEPDELDSFDVGTGREELYMAYARRVRTCVVGDVASAAAAAVTTARSARAGGGNVTMGEGDDRTFSTSSHTSDSSMATSETDSSSSSTPSPGSRKLPVSLATPRDMSGRDASHSKDRKPSRQSSPSSAAGASAFNPSGGSRVDNAGIPAPATAATTPPPAHPSSAPSPPAPPSLHVSSPSHSPSSSLSQGGHASRVEGLPARGSRHPHRQPMLHGGGGISGSGFGNTQRLPPSQALSTTVVDAAVRAPPPPPLLNDLDAELLEIIKAYYQYKQISIIGRDPAGTPSATTIKRKASTGSASASAAEAAALGSRSAPGARPPWSDREREAPYARIHTAPASGNGISSACAAAATVMGARERGATAGTGTVTTAIAAAAGSTTSVMAKCDRLYSILSSSPKMATPLRQPPPMPLCGQRSHSNLHSQRPPHPHEDTGADNGDHDPRCDSGSEHRKRRADGPRHGRSHVVGREGGDEDAWKREEAEQVLHSRNCAADPHTQREELASAEPTHTVSRGTSVGNSRDASHSNGNQNHNRSSSTSPTTACGSTSATADPAARLLRRRASTDASALADGNRMQQQQQQCGSTPPPSQLPPRRVDDTMQVNRSSTGGGCIFGFPTLSRPDENTRAAYSGVCTRSGNVNDEEMLPSVDFLTNSHNRFVNAATASDSELFPTLGTQASPRQGGVGDHTNAIPGGSGAWVGNAGRNSNGDSNTLTVHRGGDAHSNSNNGDLSHSRNDHSGNAGRGQSLTASVIDGLPSYSATSFVRAYVSSDMSLNLEPAVIVSGLAAALNIIVVYFLRNHVLDTRDHLGVFLIGSYLIFASYYMIYYFLERFSSSFRRISSHDKKFYIIGNLLKAGIFISITPFAFYHLIQIIVFDEWQGDILRNLGCIYSIPDFISMIIVKRMRWSTFIHHALVVLFNYFSVVNDYKQENICRCLVVYAAFSSFSYCVNVLLASRFLGVSVAAARVLSFISLVVYVFCCAVNWAWQVYYLRRLLLGGNDHWTVYVYMFLICLVMWDDLVLCHWLLSHAKSSAFAATQQLQTLRRQQQQQQQQQQQSGQTGVASQLGLAYPLM